MLMRRSLAYFDLASYDAHTYYFSATYAMRMPI